MKHNILYGLIAALLCVSLLTSGVSAASNPFTDVSSSDWYYTDVMTAVETGLVNGKTSSAFCPDDNLTYAEAIKLAACMNQLYWNGLVTLTNGDPWYRPYVDYAFANGILSEACDWNASATRAGYMALFAHALPAFALAGINDIPDSSIPDVSVSHPQAEEIYTLYRAGIVQGTDAEHSCSPDSLIKRSEVAAILTRMMYSSARLSFTTAQVSDNGAGWEISLESGTSPVSDDSSAPVTAQPVQTSYTPVSASYSLPANGLVQSSELFTDRDLLQNADLSEASYLTVTDNSTLDITKAGIYVLTGSARDCTIRITADKEDDKVQLVLDGVSIINGSFPAIYVVSADKVFVTTAEESYNTLSVTGAFVSDSVTGNNTDAVIFSKDDLVLNGLGTLTLDSRYGNGITSKDELKITGGMWILSSALDTLEANDSIAACAGTFDITSSKDGLHCENDDAEGYIWIGGGTWTVRASADGIQGTSFVQIDDGTLSISAKEGIEGTNIQINGGDITITASDDGINASRKSTSYPVNIEINGGTLTVSVGQGDTDAIDSNGSITVNGGTIIISCSGSSFDYDGTATYNGGTMIINGQTVNSIPQSLMGGGGMGGRGGRP